jgi:hypothetical protein
MNEAKEGTQRCEGQTLRNVIEGKLFEFVQLYVAKRRGTERRETVTGKGESADTTTANEMRKRQGTSALSERKAQKVNPSPTAASVAQTPTWNTIKNAHPTENAKVITFAAPINRGSQVVPEGCEQSGQCSLERMAIVPQ